MSWASPVTVTPPAEEPVTLAAAKEFVGIEADEADFDMQLGGFIAAAREHLENLTGTRFIEQAVELRADGFADLERLPIGPVSAVTAIAYDDTAGAEQVLDDAAYELTGAGLERGVRPVFGGSWPAAARRSGAVRVTATVGYAELPRPLWIAILQIVADLFAHRETAVTGSIASPVPAALRVEDALANYRIWL